MFCIMKNQPKNKMDTAGTRTCHTRSRTVADDGTGRAACARRHDSAE